MTPPPATVAITSISSTTPPPASSPSQPPPPPPPPPPGYFSAVSAANSAVTLTTQPSTLHRDIYTNLSMTTSYEQSSGLVGPAQASINANIVTGNNNNNVHVTARSRPPMLQRSDSTR